MALKHADPLRPLKPLAWRFMVDTDPMRTVLITQLIIMLRHSRGL